MTYGTSSSAVLIGVDIVPLKIEASLLPGYTGLQLLGLPPEAARDMKERLRTVLESNNLAVCGKRILVQVRAKESLKLARTPLSLLDLPIAVAIWQAHALAKLTKARKGQNKNPDTEHASLRAEIFALGEFSLLGKISLQGNNLFAMAAIERQNKECLFFVPPIGGEKWLRKEKIAHLRPVNFFSEVFSRSLETLNHRPASHQPRSGMPNSPSGTANHKSHSQQQNQVSQKIEPYQVISTENTFWQRHQDELNLQMPKVITSWMRQPQLAISLILAASTRSHTLICGCPGIGKSYSISLLPFLLPPLTFEEELDRLLIETGSDRPDHKPFPDDTALRPFRTVHHSCSVAGLLGNQNLRPGELTLAHRGVLFLDELLEFPRSRLECLREPLETKRVELARAAGCRGLPADIQLLAATNPCHCGYYLSEKVPCRCQPTERKRYWSQLSGPMLDRFAIRIAIAEQISNAEMSARIPPTEQNLMFDIAYKTLNSITRSSGVPEEFLNRFTNLQRANYGNGPMPFSTPLDPNSVTRTSQNLRAQIQEDLLVNSFCYLFCPDTSHPTPKERISILSILRSLEKNVE